MRAKFKYRKILKYLKAKDEDEYNNLDRIFQLYVTEQLQEKLKNYNFSNIQIFPSISKREKSIQLCFNYFNLSVIWDFYDSYYEHCIYLPEDLAGEFERNIVKKYYHAEFTIEQFLCEFSLQLEKEIRLIKK